MNNYWFKVPMSIWDDNDDDHKKVLAEIYLRMLAQRNGGTITTNMNKIAQFLQWDEQKFYKFLRRLTKRGVLTRNEVEVKWKWMVNDLVCGTTTYASKEKRKGSEVEMNGNSYIIEKERKIRRKEFFNLKKREEEEMKRKLEVFGESE